MTGPSFFNAKEQWKTSASIDNENIVLSAFYVAQLTRNSIHLGQCHGINFGVNATIFMRG